jgi:hypothetical protein
LRMEAAKGTIPFLSRAMGELNNNIEESGGLVGVLRFGFDDIWRAATGGKAAIEDESGAIEEVGDASEETSDSLDALAESQKEAEDTAKRLTGAYSGLLSSMFSIQKENDSYDKQIANITKKDAELAASKNQLTLKMWEEQRAGKLTNEQYLEYVQKLDEVTQAEQENAASREQLAKDNAKASEQRVYDLAKEQLAADGLITTGEFEYLQKIAVQKGLVSQEAANQALAERQAADQIVASFGDTNNAMLTTLSTMQAIAAYSGQVVNFGVNFQTNRPAGNTFGTNGINYSQSFRPGQGSPMSVPGGSRDNGGPGVAGTPYMIGTGAQPEVFTPDTNGTFTPANKLGSTYNITVNNPKKETAENSIRKSLKSLSYAGVAQ